jgi:hypothetical protein
MLIARHCPAQRDETAGYTADLLRELEPRHLLWIADPDGQQVPPELNYFTHFLSSEMPECLIATYWEGRRQGALVLKRVFLFPQTATGAIRLGRARHPRRR